MPRSDAAPLLLLLWVSALLLPGASMAEAGVKTVAAAGCLRFARPTRVFGNGTARTYGGLYADAFYTLVADGPGSSVFFGSPGLGISTPADVLLSEDSGGSWRPWCVAMHSIALPKKYSLHPGPVPVCLSARGDCISLLLPLQCV